MTTNWLVKQPGSKDGAGCLLVSENLVYGTMNKNFPIIWRDWRAKNQSQLLEALPLVVRIIPSLPLLLKGLRQSLLLQKHLQFIFLTISYLFSIPTNCSFLKFHCSIEVLHLEKLEKIFFQVGKIIFSIFPHEKAGKVKKYSVTKIVLTFYCLNLKNITNSWPSASNLQNFFSTHFSWHHYPGKIQNYSKTNFSHSRSEQLW